MKHALGEEWATHFMDHGDDPVDTACPRCGAKARIDPNSVFVCHACSVRLSKEEAGYYSRMAFDCAYFGYTYRRAFEGSRKGIRYYIPPEDVLIYIGGVALSAVLGGLAYDGFKKLLAKASGSNTNKKLAERISEMSDAELEGFFQYVNEYHNWRLSNKVNEERARKLKDTLNEST